MRLSNNKFTVQTSWQRADIEAFFDYDQVPGTMPISSGIDLAEASWVLGEMSKDMLTTCMAKMNEFSDKLAFIHKQDDMFQWDDYTYIVDGVTHTWSDKVIPDGRFDRWEGGHNLAGLLIGTALVAVIGLIVPVGPIMKTMMAKHGIRSRHRELMSGIDELSHSISDFSTAQAPEVPELLADDNTEIELMKQLMRAFATNSRQPLVASLRTIDKATTLTE